MSETIPRIVLTAGEPAGIGPDIIVAASQQAFPAELVFIGDPTLLTERATQLNLPLELFPIDFSTPPTAKQAKQLKFYSTPLVEEVTPGQLDLANAPYVLRTLEMASELCLTKQVDAVVTGPVQKSLMLQAGIEFKGHTEYFAARANVQDVLMLFVLDELKVATLTTHIPLNKVSKAITRERLLIALRLLQNELLNKFGVHDPSILVCGLNPHAGEEGELGVEEGTIIAPAILELRNEMSVIGPLPADTVFTPHYLEMADAVLGMYHDQVLPVVKFAGFDRAVNVTLGLPFIRTSVDHGTALDLAGTGKANPGSMLSAIHLAIKLAQNP